MAYLLVNSFYLPIQLWVVSRYETDGDPQPLYKPTSHFGYELWTLVNSFIDRIVVYICQISQEIIDKL